MSQPIGNGALFAGDAKSRFTTITGSRYDGMVVRAAKKKLPALPFTKAQFRVHVLDALGNAYDGAIQCPYCKKFCTLPETAADHKFPLSRGGSSGLENIELLCSACNQAKGSMTPPEFRALRHFLATVIPLARVDVLGRLQKAVKLAAGTRRNAALITKLKATGHWPSKARKPKQDLDDTF